VGAAVGDSDSSVVLVSFVMEGESVRNTVGVPVGTAEGGSISVVGFTVGLDVGAFVVADVGLNTGGEDVGESVGASVGSVLGARVSFIKCSASVGEYEGL